jgi:hypothetical protein
VPGHSVTDTYCDGAPFWTPLFLFPRASLCCFLLFPLRYKEAELPRVTIQKPDGLFGHLGHYSTAFRLLGRFDLETVLDSIVFHGSTSIVSSVIPLLRGELLGILAGRTRSDNKTDGLIVFALFSLSSTRTLFMYISVEDLGLTPQS